MKRTKMKTTRRAIDYWSKKNASNKVIQRLEYPNDVDEELLPLLDILNSIPGVRTLFSCCGHSKEPFYIVIGFTSLEARHLITQMLQCFEFFAKNKYKLLDIEDDHYPHATFKVEEFWCGRFSKIVKECEVGFYSEDLGLKSKVGRVKDYKRICNFLLTLVPDKHWK